MAQNLKKLFNSFASKPDSMKQNEFEKFIKDTKIYNEQKAGQIFKNYCINNSLSFDSFKFALKEIAILKEVNFEQIIDEVFGLSEKKELEKIEKKKKEVIKRQENLKKDANIKSEEKIKNIVEDMCIMGNIMKKEIINEKKNHPEKFIPIEEAIKDKENDNGINFCLGILAKSLEDIGITTAIEKETSDKEESIKASETVIQFIMNGMIDKKKLDLHFDFGSKRNNELLNNEKEQEKLHTKLKRGLSKTYKIPENDIIITNPQKGSYNVQVIFMSKDFNEKDISEFQHKCKNAKELEDLKYLKEIHTTLIMEGCKLTRDM